MRLLETDATPWNGGKIASRTGIISSLLGREVKFVCPWLNFLGRLFPHVDIMLSNGAAGWKKLKTGSYGGRNSFKTKEISGSMWLPREVTWK